MKRREEEWTGNTKSGSWTSDLRISSEEEISV